MANRRTIVSGSYVASAVLVCATIDRPFELNRKLPPFGASRIGNEAMRFVEEIVGRPTRLPPLGTGVNGPNDWLPG